MEGTGPKPETAGLLRAAARAFSHVNEALYTHGELTPELQTALQTGRDAATRCRRVVELHVMGLHELSSSADDEIVAFQLFASLFNDTWKLFMGDSNVRLGHGIEEDPDFRAALLEFFQNSKAFLEVVLAASSDKMVSSPGELPRTTLTADAVAAYAAAVHASMAVDNACLRYSRLQISDVTEGAGQS